MPPNRMQRKTTNRRFVPEGQKGSLRPQIPRKELREIRDIVQLLAEPACVLDQSGRLVLANEAMQQTLGAKEEILGIQIQKLLSLSSVESERLVAAVFGHQERAIVRILGSGANPGSVLEFDGGRLHSQDDQGGPLAFLRLRALGKVSERLRRVTNRLIKDLGLARRGWSAKPFWARSPNSSARFSKTP